MAGGLWKCEAFEAAGCDINRASCAGAGSTHHFVSSGNAAIPAEAGLKVAGAKLRRWLWLQACCGLAGRGTGGRPQCSAMTAEKLSRALLATCPLTSQSSPRRQRAWAFPLLHQTFRRRCARHLRLPRCAHVHWASQHRPLGTPTQRHIQVGEAQNPGPSSQCQRSWIRWHGWD